MLAARATRNSASDTEPIAVRGSIRPAVIRVGVVTGPQPPPPMASITPPKRPSGTRKCGRRCDGSAEASAHAEGEPGEHVDAQDQEDDRR